MSNPVRFETVNVMMFALHSNRECEINSAFCVSLYLSPVNLFNSIRVSNSLNPAQAWHFVGPDLDLNCLQRL